MTKRLVTLTALLLCVAMMPVLAEEDAITSVRPRPAIDVELWARPQEAAPGEIVFVAGQVVNLGRLADKVTVSLTVESRYFAARLGRWDFRLRSRERARFATRFRVPRLRPGTVLVFEANARSVRGATDTDAVRVLVVP